MIKLAKITSLIFGIPWLPIIIIITLFKSGLSQSQLLILTPILLLLEFLIPLLAMYVLIKLSKISDWDIRKKEERKLILGIFVLCSLISLTAVYFWGNDLLFKIISILFLNLLILTIITRFWKISLHVSITTVCVILINYLFGWSLVGLYLLIPIVAWSRYILAHHNAAQLIGGFIVSSLVIWGLLQYV